MELKLLTTRRERGKVVKKLICFIVYKRKITNTQNNLSLNSVQLYLKLNELYLKLNALSVNCKMADMFFLHKLLNNIILFTSLLE